MISKISEMETSIIKTFICLSAKISTLFTNIYGWLSVIIASLITFFIDLKLLFIILSTLLIIDLVLGFWNNKYSIQSSRLRDTLVKSLFYIIIICSTFSIEKIIGLSFVYKIVWVVACLVELISIVGNMIIILPNNKFLKLFKFMLDTEISKNIGLSKESYDKIVNN